MTIIGKMQQVPDKLFGLSFKFFNCVQFKDFDPSRIRRYMPNAELTNIGFNF